MSEVEAAIVTGVLGLMGGTIGTYLVQRYSEQKKQYLSTKREQLQYVFAPLDVLLKMNKAEFARYFKNDTTDDDREFIEKYIWYPNNTEIKKIIMEKSHLMTKIPDQFVSLLTHINVWLTEYQLVYEKHSKNPPVFAGTRGYNYPKGVDEYIFSETDKLRHILNIDHK